MPSVSTAKLAARDIRRCFDNFVVPSRYPKFSMIFQYIDFYFCFDLHLISLNTIFLFAPPYTLSSSFSSEFHTLSSTWKCSISFISDEMPYFFYLLVFTIFFNDKIVATQPHYTTVKRKIRQISRVYNG